MTEAGDFVCTAPTSDYSSICSNISSNGVVAVIVEVDVFMRSIMYKCYS